MFSDNIISSVRWSPDKVERIKNILNKHIESQVDNIMSTIETRPNDNRDRQTVENSTLLGVITELTVCKWLNGRRNDLTFDPSDPYSYAWDLFAKGRRIEVKKFSSRNFNINPKQRGGGCIDMHTFETFDIADALFACKVSFDTDIIVEPIFFMTRESYFNCRVKSEQRPGTFYLQFEREARENPHTCKVY